MLYRMFSASVSWYPACDVWSPLDILTMTLSEVASSGKRLFDPTPGTSYSQ